MRPLSIDHTTAVDLLLEQTDSFVTAANGFSEYDLLGASRVHAWSRLDAIVHVRAGLEEMVGVCAAQVDDEPDHDAASYWASFAASDPDDDPVPQILWMRRTAAAYTRPSGALRHLADVVATGRIALRHMPDHPVLFQGKTMSSRSTSSISARAPVTRLPAPSRSYDVPPRPSRTSTSRPLGPTRTRP